MFPVKQTVNLHVFCHKGSKSFQNSAFDSVFVTFPVKHTVIYTFSAITSIQNTCFCSVFNALASKNLQNLAMYNVFFIFGRFFHCRKATKMTQNSISIPSLRSDTQKSSKNVENTTVFWSRCETVFGGPPPAKADIATAILTNVIEHLVLLLPPNKHAFTAKAVWADFSIFSYIDMISFFAHCASVNGRMRNWWAPVCLCVCFSVSGSETRKKLTALRGNSEPSQVYFVYHQPWLGSSALAENLREWGPADWRNVLLKTC